MPRIIDLSHPISHAMPVFPGDPEVSFEQIHSITEIGYNVTRVCIGTHSGTHIDVPRHCLDDERGADSVPLDALVGWAEVLDLTDRLATSEITATDLDAFANRVEEGSRVLIKTGWSARFGGNEFFTDFPGITKDAALWLAARKVKLLGIEQPSVHAQHHLEVHKILLSTGMVLVESVANLDKVTQDRVYLIALPLRMVGLDGAPTRVIAVEGQLV